MTVRRLCLTFLALVFGCVALVSRGAETLPPAPAAHFNDYARLIPASSARALDARLAQFERETSNQILVVVYPRMESKSSVEDYTVRIAQSWRVGQKARNNGAVLFAFMAERQLRIEVGYGLEGALPDATAYAIITDELTPRFRSGDFTGGFDAAITAMISATRGEYTGTGRTRAERDGTAGGGRKGAGELPPWLVIVLFFVFVIGSHFFRRLNPRSSGYGGGSGWSSGSDWGSGGGGSGGGFSGGGGSFGGGGASGKW